MFERARSLVLTDREKARKALRDEIAEQEEKEFEEELNALEVDERQRREREAEETDELRRAAEASARLREVRGEQHEQAKRFDAAARELGSAFDELERLASEAALLERSAGEGPGQRPSVASHARSTALVAAMWLGARDLCRRVGLRRVPSGPNNVRPLTTSYPRQEEK